MELAAARSWLPPTAVVSSTSVSSSSGRTLGHHRQRAMLKGAHLKHIPIHLLSHKDLNRSLPSLRLPLSLRPPTSPLHQALKLIGISSFKNTGEEARRSGSAKRSRYAKLTTESSRHPFPSVVRICKLRGPPWEETLDPSSKW